MFPVNFTSMSPEQVKLWAVEQQKQLKQSHENRSNTPPLPQKKLYSNSTRDPSPAWQKPYDKRNTHQTYSEYKNAKKNDDRPPTANQELQKQLDRKSQDISHKNNQIRMLELQNAKLQDHVRLLKSVIKYGKPPKKAKGGDKDSDEEISA